MNWEWWGAEITYEGESYYVDEHEVLPDLTLDDEVYTYDVQLSKTEVEELIEIIDALEQCDQFPVEVFQTLEEDEGFTSVKEANNAYIGKYPNGVTFAKEYAYAHYPMELPSFVVINWEAAWDNIKDAYVTVNYAGNLYIFNTL